MTFCTLPACAVSRPLGLAVGNLMEADFYPDVAVVNGAVTGGPESVSVFRNTTVWTTPQQGLAAPIIYALNAPPYDIEAADVGANAASPSPDGHLDLIVTFLAGVNAQFAILYNDGEGGFGNIQYVPLQHLDASLVFGLAVADFDQDGTNDVAVGGAKSIGPGRFEGGVELQWREPSGGAWTSTFWTASAGGGVQLAPGTEIVAGKVQVEGPSGLPDLVMGTNANEMLVLLNTGERAFTATVEPGTQTLGLALGLFRPGPNLDLAVAGEGENFVDRYFGDGLGGFQRQDPRYSVLPGQRPFGMAVGKVNVDAGNDIVVALATGGPCGIDGGGIAVFVGYGNGTFELPPYLFCVEPGGSPKPCFVKIADMDQDGFNDVVTSNNSSNSNSISVLINAFPN